MSVLTAQNILKLCWIDIYLGPLDQIIYNVGTNFLSKEFRINIKEFAIQIKEILIEAYQSVGKIERAYRPLRRAYNIISKEIGDTLNREEILQIAQKAVNDTARPNRLIPTLLVFRAILRISKESLPS